MSMQVNKKVLSGMRPTGKLHLGHLSVLENWAKLQEEYNCSYFIADWHALTTSFDDTESIRANSREMTIDWLSAGLDPQKCIIFRQSDVKQHAELHLLLSMITPLSWLERVPTYKDQIQQFGSAGKDIAMYGFLGYPLLMASDILLYRAGFVPVGQDQLPHLEFSRELVRRFNNMYDCEVLVEPQPLLAKIKMLPGIDKRKMSKSYGNDIALSASPKEVKSQVHQMVTDPARIRKDDPGHPDICTVYSYQGFYNEAEQAEIGEACRAGQIGCGECKKRLTAKMNEFLAPILARRAVLIKDQQLVDDVLAAGAAAAQLEAEATMQLVREALKI
ncbi:MAG: tryptophan--tRNA ligase [Bacillota bacterium]|jgi:tryptophanyl-tRNA synthetase